MMKKYKILGMIMMLVALAGAAHAYVDGTVNFNVPDVDVRVFNCADSSCTAGTPFTGEVFGTATGVEGEYHTDTSQITIRFPSTLSQNGYAIFYVKEGYLLAADWANFHSFGSDTIATTSWQIDFTKKAECSAVVNQLNIQDEDSLFTNMPLIIDSAAGLGASTESAFSFSNHPVKFVPADLEQEFVGVDTEVQLVVRDSANNIRHNEVQQFTADNGNAILADAQVPIQFSWTPVLADSYTAEVTTTVVDEQCQTSQEASTSKNFVVLDEAPRNMCYTLVNNLEADPANPNVDDRVTLSYNKISNHASDAGALRAVATTATYEITGPDGSIVFTDTVQLGANGNAQQSSRQTFSFTPDQEGSYGVKVTGTANSALCDGLENNAETITLMLPVGPLDRYAVTFQIIDSVSGQSVPNVQVDMAGVRAVTDANGIAIIGNLAPADYSYTVSHQDYNALSGKLAITDHDLSLTLPLNPGSILPNDNTYTATFTVTDKETGKVITDATVDVDNTDGLTNGLGQIAFTSLADDTYDFFVSKEDYRAVQGTFTVAGSDVNILIALELLDEEDRKDPASRGIFIDSVRIPNAYDVEPGENLQIRITFENRGDKEMDAIATAVIPELGARGSVGPFDLEDSSDRETRVMQLPIPSTAQPGYYWVRISLGEGKLTRVLHREVLVR